MLIMCSHTFETGPPPLLSLIFKSRSCIESRSPAQLSLGRLGSARLGTAGSNQSLHAGRLLRK